MGQIRPEESLPPKEGFACPACISFKEWDDYCLIHGFRILEALGVASKIDSRIPAVALRLMHMPGARNKTQPDCARAFFAATDVSSEDEFATRLSGLKEGERLGVCFNTHNTHCGFRVENRRAIVVRTVSSNQDEYTVALIRPFDKVQGKHADIPPRNTRAHPAWKCQNP